MAHSSEFDSRTRKTGPGEGTEDLFRSFFMDSPLSYQSLDLEGRFLDVNPAWETTFGYSREEVHGINFSELLTTTSRTKAQQCFPVFKERGEVRDVPFEIIHKDGQLVLVNLHGRANYNENGTFLSTNCILLDVTEKQRLQEDRIRTERLASIGELSASVAHEINNPISGVINYSQILLNQKGLSESQRDILTRIQSEGVRIADIVHNLLNFSRDSRGGKAYHDLRRIVENSLVLLNPKMEQTGVRIVFEWPDNLPAVQCNQQQIEQVLINILRNASQALLENPKDDRQVTIRAEVERNNTHGTLHLIIANNGPHIPPEVMRKILDPFFTTKPVGFGTGLGLSISSTIMKEHGGELVVRSEPDGLTEMMLGFPIDGMRP